MYPNKASNQESMLIFHRYNYKVEIDSHDLNNLTMKSMDQVFFPFFLKNKKRYSFKKKTFG